MRYTPTCVGKTRTAASKRAVFEVHPHVRGENFLPFQLNSTRIGTPPRAWGKLHQLGYNAALAPVHPHVRGENVSEYLANFCHKRYTPTCVGKTYGIFHLTIWLSGTPPRAWGKLSAGCPATPTGGVHPHVRGENCFFAIIGYYRKRYTPTCVGKTDCQK